MWGDRCTKRETEVSNDDTGEKRPITSGTMYLLNGHEKRTPRPTVDSRFVCYFNPPVTGREDYGEDSVIVFGWVNASHQIPVPNGATPVPSQPCNDIVGAVRNARPTRCTQFRSGHALEARHTADTRDRRLRS